MAIWLCQIGANASLTNRILHILCIKPDRQHCAEATLPLSGVTSYKSALCMSEFYISSSIYQVVVYRAWTTLMWSRLHIYICLVFLQLLYILCHYHFFLQSIPSIYTSLGKAALFCIIQANSFLQFYYLPSQISNAWFPNIGGRKLPHTKETKEHIEHDLQQQTNKLTRHPNTTVAWTP